MIKSKTGLLKKRSFVLKKGHLYIILLNYTFQWYANNSDLLWGGGVVWSGFKENGVGFVFIL